MVDEKKESAIELKEDLLIDEENLDRNRKLFKKYIAFFASVFILVGVFFAGVHVGQKREALSEQDKAVLLKDAIIENKLPTDKNVDFSLFWKVWDLLKQKHIDKDSFDAKKLEYGAIKGMLQATGDPYTNFFDPEETKSFSEDIGGNFDGIGAELGVKDSVLTVIAPLDSSPAQKSGLLAGDKILKINGKVSQDLTIDQAVGLIRGPKGTQVTLTIFRQGEDNTRDVVITRDTIDIKSVKTEFKDNIAYVKITKFGENTSKEFSAAADQIITRKSKGIVLDLRNNPGGLLSSAVEIASALIPKGKVVVTEQDSAGNKDDLKTTGGDKLSSIPLVVLINEGSASASEILSGALRDDRNITLVGKKSFGKGCVQELSDLPEKTSVKITVAKWLTPNGDYIMDKGIMPGVEVSMTADDFKNNLDPQLDKAMEVIKVTLGL